MPQVVDPVAAAQPAARSKDLLRAMKEMSQGMKTSSAAAAREVDAKEQELRRQRELADERKEQLVATTRAVSGQDCWDYYIRSLASIGDPGVMSCNEPTMQQNKIHYA